MAWDAHSEEWDGARLFSFISRGDTTNAKRRDKSTPLILHLQSSTAGKSDVCVCMNCK